MTDVEHLTNRQREIYQFIREAIGRRGYGPTLREIGQRFDIESPNGVMNHLKALQNKGLIHRELNMSRAVGLSSDSPSLAAPVEVPPEVVDLVLSLADQNGIEPGDVILKAVTLLKIVEDAQREGKGIAIVDADLNVEQEIRGF
jgi:SOS-response transcriptional repressor LexA